jgi:hypothetical protein
MVSARAKAVHCGYCKSDSNTCGAWRLTTRSAIPYDGPQNDKSARLFRIAWYLRNSESPHGARSDPLLSLPVKRNGGITNGAI